MAVRVLVADDTDHVREMLCAMLTVDGFEVVGVAEGGAQAVALAQDTDPDVVIMDLRMPEVDGLAASRQIRAVRPHQQIVLYTAYLDATIEEQAREAGVALCLGKVEGLHRLERELSRLALGLAGQEPSR